MVLHHNPRSPFLQNLEANLEKENIEILDHEEWLLLMKSRINWIFEGERNTSFFHKVSQLKDTLVISF